MIFFIDKLYEKSETGCCLRFDPKSWDEKKIKFNDKLFLKDSILSVFHIPLNFGKVMARNMEKIAAANALPPEPLLLSDSCSLWKTIVYIAVSKNVPNSELTKISGTFLTKVFEGHFKDSGKWVKEMQDYVKSKGKKEKKIYFFYTTCPKCAEYYGKNYVVLLAQV